MGTPPVEVDTKVSAGIQYFKNLGASTKAKGRRFVFVPLRLSAKCLFSCSASRSFCGEIRNRSLTVAACEE